ncbi:manganese efflux pump MntP [Proteus sp. DFP240708]|uniref:Putative manganese efflux pump MntP n=2 Tax=Proteus TaxID=583 RepID=A0A6I7DDS8_9GAMM|nr:MULTISPECIES: manganese efflux pump MntP [Proteus]MBG2803873.1 manganese efflux pump MntP [Proteus mirabilis]MBG3021549.1 manganese efflux pump MntP [Proteus mirabilis]MBG3153396.1 manganese efflux pump MntP [Proteus mirabilis]MBI6218229.1 manganese efflux pump MntP [Proteus vulgaris]MBI6405440.1 manganese efflux pump MntP [Proteus sp. PR00208]
MSFYATIILALALSMDAFAVAVCKGATLHKPRFREALRTGFIFGIIEASTPVIGWAIGLYTSQYIIQWDHWVAFGLLFVLGSRMIYQSLKRGDDCPCEEEAPQRHGSLSLIATGIATSLDAMAIGVGLAFLQVNIVHTAMTIGMMTMIMATLGMLIGRYIGPVLGKKAEIIGGIVLIAIGFNIVFEHLELFMYAK